MSTMGRPGPVMTEGNVRVSISTGSNQTQRGGPAGSAGDAGPLLPVARGGPGGPAPPPAAAPLRKERGRAQRPRAGAPAGGP